MSCCGHGSALDAQFLLDALQTQRIIDGFVTEVVLRLLRDETFARLSHRLQQTSQVHVVRDLSLCNELLQDGVNDDERASAANASGTMHNDGADRVAQPSRTRCSFR